MALALSDIKKAAVDAQRAGDIEKAKKLKALYFKAESQMGPGPTAVQPQQETDSAIEYSVDQAQRLFGKGAEAIGRATGIKRVEDFGTRTVAQQDIDIQRGGYQPQYTGSLEDNFNQGGFSQAAGWLKEKAAENVATSGFMLGGAAATALTSAVSVPAAYIMGAATMGGGLALGTGEAAFEQEEKLGDYNEVLSVGAGSIIALLDRFGAGKVIPKSKLLKMTTKEITDELNKKGFTRAAAAFSRRALTEGATEAAQEGVSMGAATTRGAEYTPKEIRDRFIDAAALGTTYGAGVQTVTGPISAISGSSEPTTQAQAAFAQRLEEIARVNNLNLNDIDKTSTEGAREAVDKAHVQMTTRLKSLFRTLKDKVKPQTLDTLQELEDKVMLEAGYREARTKTKNVVGQQEIDATEKLIGQYGEGQEILNLYGELNEMTRLHNSQYQGGLSKYTDILSPLGSNVGYDKSVISSERVLRPLATGTLAMNTGGASLIPQVAVVGAGRAIDALTGRRSRVRRYVAKHKKKSAFSNIPQSSYLHEQNRIEGEKKKANDEKRAQEQAVRDEQRRQFKLNNYQNFGQPNYGDAQYIAMDGTGIENVRDFREALAYFQTEGTNDPYLKDLITTMDEYMRGNVDRVPDFGFEWIAPFNTFMDANPAIRDSFNIKPETRNAKTEGRDRAEGRSPRSAAQAGRDAAIQRGIDDNNAEVQRLIDELEVDPDVRPIEKVKIRTALDRLFLDLGANPVVAIDNIRRGLSQDGVSDAAIDKYFNPYVERVNQQQANRPIATQPEQDEGFFLDDDPVEITESRQAPILSLAPGVNMLDVYEGREELPKIKTKAEAGKYLQDRALEKLGGTPRDLNNEADRDAIADDMVAEAIFEQQSQEEQNALQWYDETVAKMLSMLSLKYPEINQDEVTRTPILIALAITSQNIDVPTNLELAVKAYDHFSKTGKFPIIGQGTSDGIMRLNFDKANKLMSLLGPEAFTDFLKTKYNAGDLTKILQQHLKKKKISLGENVDTVVYGSAVFGPKVGNGFYSNLRGDFSPVTMDMWFMRTVGRLRGKVLDLNEAKLAKQIQRLKTALGRKRMSRDAAITKALELVSKHEKDYKNHRADYDSGKRKKSEATFAAQTIKKSVKGTIDTPANGTERNQLRDVVTRAVSKYNEKTGMEITPAAFQALIWYPEQDLYKNLGVQLKATRADYASSTKRLLLEDGFNEEDIGRAESIRISEEPGPGSARQTTVQINEARSGQPGERTSGPVLQNQETKPVLESPTEQLNLIPPEIENFRGSRPTNGRIKENIPEAEDIVKGYFDIGKEGGRYENGITDRADLDRLMTALNVTHVAVKKFSQLKAHAGNKAKDIDRRSLGFAVQDLRNNLVNSKIVTAAPGFKDIKGRPITDLEALTILIHEIGHTIEGRPGGNVDYSSVLNDAYSDINQVYNVEKVKGLSGLDENRPDLYGAKTHLVVGTDDLRTSTRNKVRSVDGIDPEGLNSFRYELYKLLSTDIPFLEKKKKAILSEIDKIRDTDFNLSVSGMPGKTPLRGWGTLKKLFGVRQQAQDRAVKLFEEDRVKHRKEIRELTKQANDLDADIMNYLYDPAEVAVDPLILYLMDPKGARKEIPVTAKFIRDFFNAPHNNIPIQFNSPPMVAILAIVLAAMATRDEEEEEKQRVPGALGMNPGALSMI
jgi:molybdopterin converting factor small subunit